MESVNANSNRLHPTVGLVHVMLYPRLAMRISQALRVMRNVSNEAIVKFTNQHAVHEQLKRLR